MTPRRADQRESSMGAASALRLVRGRTMSGTAQLLLRRGSGLGSHPAGSLLLTPKTAMSSTRSRGRVHALSARGGAVIVLVARAQRSAKTASVSRGVARPEQAPRAPCRGKRPRARAAKGRAGPGGLGVPVRPESMAWLDELGRAVQLDAGAGGTAGAGCGPAGLTLTLARKPDGDRRPRRCGLCRRRRGACSGESRSTLRPPGRSRLAHRLTLFVSGSSVAATVEPGPAAVLVPGGVIGEDDHRPQRLRGGPAGRPRGRTGPSPTYGSRRSKARGRLRTCVRVFSWTSFAR
jgi:hypothetical protein